VTASIDGSAAGTPRTTSRRALGFIFATVFLDLLGVGILIPVIPFLVRQFTPSGLAVGLLALSYSLAQFGAAPLLGRLSDRVGRRPVLVASVLGSGIAYVVFGLATALWVMFLARIVDGLSGGNITAAQAYIADVSAPEDRAKNFGLIGAAFGLGFIIGPALGGVLSHISLAAPAYAAGAMALVTALFGILALPESLPSERRNAAPLTVRDLNPLRPVADALAQPALRLLMLAVFAQGFAGAELRTNFAVFTAGRFHMGPAENALIFSFIGVVGLLVQGVLLRRLTSSCSERGLTLTGLAIMVVGYFAVAFVPTVPLLYAALALVSLGGGLSTPTLTGLISLHVGATEQGAVLGAVQSLQSLTLIVGPVWAGAFFDHVSMGSPYWTAALWVLLALAAVLRSPASRHRPT
jgi:DHA1 family tetracycline resistance protein-like MFS transporter